MKSKHEVLSLSGLRDFQYVYIYIDILIVVPDYGIIYTTVQPSSILLLLAISLSDITARKYT